MRRFVFAVLGGLLALSSSAWAGGQLVVWDRIEGVFAPALTGIQVGPILPSGRSRTVGGGWAMLNLRTGSLSFAVHGMTFAEHYPNFPLGAPGLAGGLWMGTVVCDSTEQFAPLTLVDTEPIEFDQGSGWFRGHVQVPEGCIERPEETVFLVRHAGPQPGQYGAFVAFGAGRRIY